MTLKSRLVVPGTQYRKFGSEVELINIFFKNLETREIIRYKTDLSVFYLGIKLKFRLIQLS